MAKYTLREGVLPLAKYQAQYNAPGITGETKKANWILMAGALVLCCAAPVRAASDDGLNGTAWSMRERGLTPMLEFWQRATLVFNGGNFMSSECQKSGYAPASYAASNIHGGIEWTATLESSKDGKMVWEGRRVGNKMTGSYTWTGPGLSGETKTVYWVAKRKENVPLQQPVLPGTAAVPPKSQDIQPATVPAKQ